MSGRGDLADRAVGRRNTGPQEPPALGHETARALLGAWALTACSPQEEIAVEEHLAGCDACAEEARRLRGAVALLPRPGSLDLDPALRVRVLDGCLERRPARVPLPGWAAPYDAESARLDALLQDFGDTEWHTPVRLRRYPRDRPASRRTTVAGVIARLRAADGPVTRALGSDPHRPVPRQTPAGGRATRQAGTGPPPTGRVRAYWRERSRGVVRTAGLAGEAAGDRSVRYGTLALPLRDALVERAFACWAHGEAIAEAVDYPYAPPAPAHLRPMLDLAVRTLPRAVAARRPAGPPFSPTGRRLVPVGAPGPTVRLEIEGEGGGEWLVALGSPATTASADHVVAHVALDGEEFCRLLAGRLDPAEATAGRRGDPEAVRAVLVAAAYLRGD
ncbi:anti-sigma factor family protein [Streptomyces sp. WMMC905]|uniref:anti-sigma factor family protein n=1 Tax=Streptomyces sp. WMMC905 TaxID=3404123 RepID=UPI003B941D3F